MTDINADLLASCKELRDALAGAMRVIFAGCPQWTTKLLEAELTRLGIPDGIGVRADRAIAKAEQV